MELPLSQILPDPKNRKEHDQEKLRSLAASIIEEGLLQPIVVRELPPKTMEGEPAYMIVAGERRFRAYQFLKYAKIPAIVLASELFPRTSIALIGSARKRLVENLQREDLTPIEEARLYRELVIDHKSTQADVAKLAGRSQPAIANALRLLELPALVQQIIQDGQLTRAHGITLVRFAKWPKVCTRIAQLAAKQGTTTKDLEHDDLPFDRTLEREKLVIEIDTSGHSYNGKPTYKIPEAMVKDPAFIDHRWNAYCLEPEKWAPEKARQDAEWAKKQAAQKKAETGRQSKMSPTEKAQRKKKITENKRNRAEVQEQLAAAEMRLAKVSDFDPAAVRVIVYEAGRAYRAPSEEQIGAAASALGISLPPKLNFDGPDGLAALKPADLVRLMAAAIGRAKSDEALKYAGEVPEQVEHLAGKTKAVASGAIKVTVQSTSSGNVARAGLAQASCTGNATDAARQAAAKHFGCAEERVTLLCTRSGNLQGVAAIYNATKKGGAK
jgi:ParB family chromosome partitioning protein